MAGVTFQWSYHWLKVTEVSLQTDIEGPDSFVLSYVYEPAGFCYMVKRTDANWIYYM